MNARTPVKVVVFDLNETFYCKSSKEEFFKFICRKEPHRLQYFFGMAWFTLQKNLNKIHQTEFKENFFNYLDKLPPEKVKTYAEEFWQQEYPHNFNSEITERLQRAKSSGAELFCATGALEVYVKPLFGMLAIDGFAGTKTTYTGKTYLVDGEACKGIEKVRRVQEFYKNKAFFITESYSDRYEELFEISEHPYLVTDGKIKPFVKRQ